MLEKMKEIIAEQLSTDADSITEATSFKDDLGADSRDHGCENNAVAEIEDRIRKNTFR